MDGKESSEGKFASMQIGQVHDRLHRLEVKDRRHWMATIAVLLSIGVALYSFTLPGIADSILAGKPLRYAVRCVLLLVVLFALRALREQRRMAQRRRELASELAVIAASETLKVAMRNGQGMLERRAAPRIVCEQRLNVTAQGPEGEQHFYGRMIDICGDGVGAIVPGILSVGQEVLLEFSLTDEEVPEAAAAATEPKSMKVAASVRQRSGFRYGFNFIGISEADRKQIQAFRGSDKVVSISGRGAAANDSTR